MTKIEELKKASNDAVDKAQRMVEHESPQIAFAAVFEVIVRHAIYVDARLSRIEKALDVTDDKEI